LPAGSTHGDGVVAAARHIQALATGGEGNRDGWLPNAVSG